MKKYILFFGLALFLLAGCGVQKSVNQPNNQGVQDTNSSVTNQNDQTAGQNANIQVQGNNPQPEVPTPAVYSLEEVAKHNQASDCWTVANAKVYDVTSFVNKHPGGAVILQGCGKDMTEFFNTKHAKQSKELLPSFYIGDLK